MIIRINFLVSVWIGVLAVAALSSCGTSRVSSVLQTDAGFGEVVTKHQLPVEKAREAWNLLGNSKLTPEERKHAITAYHLAVDEVVEELRDQKSLREWKEWMSLSTQNGDRYPIKIDLAPRGVQSWNPRLFDDLDNVKKLKGYANAEEWRWTGVGRVYVGQRKPRNSDPNKRFFPPRGQFLPVTVILEFPPGATSTPTLRFLDPREVRTLKIGDLEWTVAADYWTAAHRSFKNRSALRVAFGGLTQPEKWLSHQGLYLLEPYRSDKIPVVFVHGLFSEPHIWESHVRALMADPELGDKIQCWYYVYPTGLPIATTSMNLREALAQVQSVEDPQAKDANPQKIMLVGHSMGGILSRLQATDSGNTFWNSWFSLPPDQVPLAKPVLTNVTKGLFFKPDPSVDRLVFIATPHRGSQMANSWIGACASALIRLPLQTVDNLTNLMSMDLDFLRVQVGEKNLSLFNSIGSLSPDHPMLKAMDLKKVEVPHHSIIGVWGQPESLQNSTDGVVPYKSSHLSSAESEHIVPYWHGCVEFPQTVQEVRRIAKLHVKESYNGKSRKKKR